MGEENSRAGEDHPWSDGREIGHDHPGEEPYDPVQPLVNSHNVIGMGIMFDSPSSSSESIMEQVD